jgi:tetratricopeptide (TPR) repeat protein
LVTESLEGEIRILRSLFWSDRDPDGRGFAQLADAYRRAGDPKQAFELLGDGLDRHPDFSPGHVVATRLYLEQGLFSEAEISARRALDLDPENVDALGSLAAALDEVGEDADAARVRLQLAALEPEPVADDLPVFDETSGDPPAGDVELGEKAAAGDGDGADVATVAAGEPEAVEEDAVDFGALAPDEPEAVDEEVVDFAALAPDEPEAAKEEIADLGALAPDEPGAADVATQEPEAEEITEDPELDYFHALEAAEPEAAEAEDPDIVDAASDESPQQIHTRTMAELYVAQGLVDRAIEVYEHLLRKDPDDTETRLRLRVLKAGEEPVADEVDDDEVETLARDLAQSGDEEHEVDTPFAWPDDDLEEQSDETDEPSIGNFFGDLLGYVQEPDPDES